MNHARGLLATLLLGAIACLNSGNAQTIPNAGFEDWPDGVLSGWETSNAPPTFTNVTKSTDAHSGSFAVLGTVVDGGVGFGIPPTIFTEPGFPVNSRPAALRGWYKSSLSGGDFIHISVALFKGEDGVGAGTAIITASSASYKEFSANIIYISEATPDTAVITANIIGSGGLPTLGSYYIVDELSWGAATSVQRQSDESPTRFALEQNYPNPFNPETNIVFEIAEKSDVSLKVFDALGREVSTLVNGQLSPGRYRTAMNASGLASGVYFYRLQSGGSIATRHLTVLK